MAVRPKKKSQAKKLSDKIDEQIRDHEHIVELVIAGRRAMRQLIIASEICRQLKMFGVGGMFRDETKALAEAIREPARYHSPPPQNCGDAPEIQW